MTNKENKLEEVIRGVNADKLWLKLEQWYLEHDRGMICQIPENLGGGEEHMTEPQGILTETAKAIAQALSDKFYIIEKSEAKQRLMDKLRAITCRSTIPCDECQDQPTCNNKFDQITLDEIGKEIIKFLGGSL